MHVVVFVANIGTISNDIQNGIYKYGIGVHSEIMGPGGGYKSQGNGGVVWWLECGVIHARSCVRAGERCEDWGEGIEEQGIVRQGGSGAWWARAKCACTRWPGALLMLHEQMALPADGAYMRASPGVQGCWTLTQVVL